MVRPETLFSSQEDFAAHLVLIDAATLPTHQLHTKSREGDLLALFEWQTCMQLSKGVALDIGEGIQRLQRDVAAFDASDVHISLIRHELLALLFRLAHWQRGLVKGRSVPQRCLNTYRSFVQELEAGYREHHNLKHYAARLGYAESTISRACLAAEGRSAKWVIDRRIALEGQRMLVHSISSIAEISHYLGFLESTNFVKFFRRITKTTPTEFRKERTGQWNSE